MIRPRICLSMIVRNEAPVIRRCLASVLPLGGVSDCVEIALGVVSGWWNMTRSGDEIKMH